MENAYDLDYVAMGHVNGDDDYDCDYDYEMKEILSGRGQPWTAVLKKMANHALEMKTYYGSPRTYLIYNKHIQ